jgi:hypothetical protein
MTRRLILTLTAALLVLAAPAQAAHKQESIVQDDRLLLNFGTGEQVVALKDLDLMGVDTVHTVINWSTLAPSRNATKPPKGVDLTDPASYNAERWRVIDSLVRETQVRHMEVLMSPSTPGPRWAEKCTSAERRRARIKGICKPDVKLYGKFVTALAKRYSGLYVDPADPTGLPLPKVRRWSISNEPNLGSWLYPSATRVRKKVVAVSAKAYRAMVYAAGDALRKNRHASDQILLGETGPVGLGTSRTAPITFYRALFCMDDRGKRLRGSAAKRLGCPKRIKRLPVTGVAHHPYTKGAAQKLTAKQRRTDATIAQIDGLSRVLRQGAHVRAITSGTASQIYFTEFGVSSSPPAKPKRYGVSLSKQAEYINQYEYMAYLNPAVRGVAQFQLEDDPIAGSHGSRRTFQTGLRLPATSAQLMAGLLGTPKPARAAYRLPLFVVDRGRTLTIWGSVRHADSGTVAIFNGRKRVKSVRLRAGYFTTSINKRKGTFTTRFGDLKSRVARPVKLR